MTNSNRRAHEQAFIDQQNGKSLSRGREQFDTVAERATYANAWLESMRVNGPARRVLVEAS